MLYILVSSKILILPPPPNICEMGQTGYFRGAEGSATENFENWSVSPLPVGNSSACSSLPHSISDSTPIENNLLCDFNINMSQERVNFIALLFEDYQIEFNQTVHRFIQNKDRIFRNSRKIIQTNFFLEFNLINVQFIIYEGEKSD